VFKRSLFQCEEMRLFFVTGIERSFPSPLVFERRLLFFCEVEKNDGLLFLRLPEGSRVFGRQPPLPPLSPCPEGDLHPFPLSSLDWFSVPVELPLIWTRFSRISFCIIAPSVAEDSDPSFSFVNER